MAEHTPTTLYTHVGQFEFAVEFTVNGDEQGCALVRAVNSHDALMNVLEAADAMCRANAGDGNMVLANMNLVVAITAARAALADAGVKE